MNTVLVVVFVMVLTSCFLVLVMIMIWKSHIRFVILYIGIIALVEFVYFTSVIYKFENMACHSSLGITLRIYLHCTLSLYSSLSNLYLLARFSQKKWFIFYIMEPKKIDMDRCVTRYRYMDVRNERGPSEGVLVEKLKEFIKDDYGFYQEAIDKDQMLKTWLMHSIMKRVTLVRMR